MKKHYLQATIYEGGYFEYFRSLVNKYGIIPESEELKSFEQERTLFDMDEPF